MECSSWPFDAVPLCDKVQRGKTNEVPCCNLLCRRTCESLYLSMCNHRVPLRSAGTYSVVGLDGRTLHLCAEVFPAHNNQMPLLFEGYGVGSLYVFRRRGDCGGGVLYG